MSPADVVSFEDESLIVVDPEDRVVGHRSKAECHDGEGILHRAFSVFLFDRDERLLVQQRSEQKRLWPLFWSNTCCSHPRRGERRMQAAYRRTKEELGLHPAEIEHLYTFTYHARFGDVGSEHEVCAVFAGFVESDPEVNPLEIQAWRWIDPEQLDRELAREPTAFSPWLHLEWPRIREEHWDRIRSLVA